MRDASEMPGSVEALQRLWATKANEEVPVSS